MLTTDRLMLVPTTLEHIEAELRQPPELGRLLGVCIPQDWPPAEYDRSAMEFFRSKLSEGGPEVVGWFGYYAITRSPFGQNPELIAGAGFFGPPTHGEVEIGYSVVPSARRHGYASEIVTRLVEFAFRSCKVEAVIAHTNESNLASIKVLARCGFQRIGAGDEPESIRFRRTRSLGNQ